jgi:hypothetical protein
MHCIAPSFENEPARQAVHWDAPVSRAIIVAAVVVHNSKEAMSTLPGGCFNMYYSGLFQ